MTTVLHAPLPGGSPFDKNPINSSSYPDLSSINRSISYPSKCDSKSPFTHAEYDRNYPSSAPSSAPSSPTYTHFSTQDSYTSTPASSLSLDPPDTQMEEDCYDETPFPHFNHTLPKPHVPASKADDTQRVSESSPAAEESPDLPDTVNDDHAVEPEPTRHVDYLSHDWREEDIWSSWRYIVRRRSVIANSTRLENASWRTWVKAKYKLKTISPETLNWMKDCDVTWLYGPLQIETKKSLTVHHSPPASQMSTSSSFLCKKPILKKKSASAAILERSRSQQSLLQRASEIIRQQQASPAHGRPILRRGGADFTLQSYTGSSVANTPTDHDNMSTVSHRQSFVGPETPADQKHVLFNEEVRQVQAIDSEDDEKDHSHSTALESDEDDDGGLVMAPSRSKGSSRSTPRGSFSNENKTIVPLPSTTLKYRTDTPEPPANAGRPRFWPSGRKLSPSPSQATLRPARPNHNFLIDDDPEVTDEPWNSSSDANYSPYEDENESGMPMRRTDSGMFMPFEDGDEAMTNKTLMGQAMYAVNTFKDIAHVVWNVGWTRR